MNLPFTPDQFFAAFGRYNEAVWPMQIVLNLLAIVVVWLLVARRAYSGRWIAAILAFFWAWMAIAYHIAYFAPINPAAWVFAVAYLAGALAFLWAGVLRNQLRFGFAGGLRSAIGGALIAYGLVLYPLLTMLLGQEYPRSPTLGLPCPTTIFTVGVLAFLMPPYPRYVLAVPVAWALLGTQAAILLGVLQDYALVVAGVKGLWLAFRSDPQARPA